MIKMFVTAVAIVAAFPIFGSLLSQAKGQESTNAGNWSLETGEACIISTDIGGEEPLFELSVETNIFDSDYPAISLTSYAWELRFDDPLKWENESADIFFVFHPSEEVSKIKISYRVDRAVALLIQQPMEIASFLKNMETTSLEGGSVSILLGDEVLQDVPVGPFHEVYGPFKDCIADNIEKKNKKPFFTW